MFLPPISRRRFVRDTFATAAGLAALRLTPARAATPGLALLDTRVISQ